MDKERADFMRRQAYREVTLYPPERLKTTERRHGKKAAQAMKNAIALDRARAFGVPVKKKP